MSDLKLSNDQILMSDEFLREFGYLGDFQLNVLVIETLCIAKELKNVSFNVDKNKKYIEATLYLSFWGLLLYNKQKIINRLSEFYSEYLPAYKFKIVFKKYRVKKNVG